MGLCAVSNPRRHCRCKVWSTTHACGCWLGLDFRLRLDRPVARHDCHNHWGHHIGLGDIALHIRGGTRTHLPGAGLSGAALVSGWAMGLTQCSVEFCSDLGCCTGATVSRINYGLLGLARVVLRICTCGHCRFRLVVVVRARLSKRASSDDAR